VQEAAHSAPLRQTKLKRSKWSEDQFDVVNWRALKPCLNTMSRVHQLSYLKLIHGLLNTNKQNYKYCNTSALCPHCKQAPESFLHMTTCLHPEVVTQWKLEQDALRTVLESLKTPPVLLGQLKAGILQTPEPCNSETVVSISSSFTISSSSGTSPHASSLRINF